MAAARSATAPAPAPVTSSDPPIDPDVGINNITHVIVIMQENRSFDHYFGTFPGADGFPRDAQGHIDVCVPDPQAGICRRPYHDTNRFDAGGPHGLVGLGDRPRRRADGRVRQGAGADRQRMRAPPRRLPVPGGRAGSGRPARHHGVPHRQRDPELLGVREALRAAGPHVRAGVVVDASLAPVPGVGLGGDMPRPRRRDELSFGPEVPGRERRRSRPQDVDPRRRDAPSLHLGGHHVAAAQAPRQLGVLRGFRDVPAPRVRPLRRTRRTPRRCRTRCPGSRRWRSITSSRTSSRTRTTSRLRRTGRSPPCRGSCRPRTGESTRRTTSATVRRG